MDVIDILIFLGVVVFMVGKAVKKLAENEKQQRTKSKGSSTAAADPWEDWEPVKAKPVTRRKAQTAASVPQARVVTAVRQPGQFVNLQQTASMSSNANPALNLQPGYTASAGSVFPAQNSGLNHDERLLEIVRGAAAAGSGRNAQTAAQFAETETGSSLTTIESNAAPCGFEHVEEVSAFDAGDPASGGTTNYHRRVIVDVRNRKHLQQGLLLSEILGRPRAFDI